jgi:hypothetical protein
MKTRQLIYCSTGYVLENEKPQVHIEHDNKIYADGVYVGFWFNDADEDGAFLMLAGQPCKKFRDANNLKLWLVKRIENIFPAVRDYLVQKFQESHPYLAQVQ